VGSVTGNFQSETPLHPAASAFLTEAFNRGWANPDKRHTESQQAAILLNEAKESIAGHLGIRRDQVEILSDPAIGYHLGISGLLREGSRLFYPANSRSEVFAIAEGISAQKLEVDSSGAAQSPVGELKDVLAWQAANAETGTIANPPDAFAGRIFVDATASGALLSLPDRWSTALWNSRAWQGPAGVGIFAIADRAIWRNPLPHFDQRVSSSDFSVPLTIASAIALDAFVADFNERRSEIRELNQEIRHFLHHEIGDVDIAGGIDTTLPQQLSFSFLYIDAEILVNELDRRGFAVDSGSACNSANMEPSHVLAAMGLLTHGNIRMTLHNGVKREDVIEFLKTLKVLIAEMRA